jgi:hypothetical protein
MVRLVREMLAALRRGVCRRRGSGGVWLSVGLVLLFLGALGWARGRDPFQRVWFSVKVSGQGNARCVAVLPKSAPRPYPVVVYLHGSGASLRGIGNDLRQMAELGLAAVGMDYCHTNDAVFERQFAALLRHLRHQRWADTNAVAWVGFGFGAENLTQFAGRHPETRPPLLVGLAGGWRPELRTNAPARTVWFLYPDTDSSPGASETCVAVAGIQTNGTRIIRTWLPGVPFDFGVERAAVFRALAEATLVELRGHDALSRNRSPRVWQSEAWPLWVWWLPAFLWFGSWFWRERRRRCFTPCASEQTPSRLERWLCRAGMLSAMLAVGAMGLHLGVPRLPVSERTLALARHVLVHANELEDFEYLAAHYNWRGQRVGTLLEHLRLARYQRSLMHWKLDDSIWREFVLMPDLGPATAAGQPWRRALWESCYPRVRGQRRSIEAAAQAVVRHLRERVTIAAGEFLPREVAAIWQRQITDTLGFEILTVAALRAVGIAARLDENGQAKLFADGQWEAAPKPATWSWLAAPGFRKMN